MKISMTSTRAGVIIKDDEGTWATLRFPADNSDLTYALKGMHALKPLGLNKGTFFSVKEMLTVADRLTVAAKAIKKLNRDVAQQYLDAAAFFKAAAKARSSTKRGSGRR